MRSLAWTFWVGMVFFVIGMLAWALGWKLLDYAMLAVGIVWDIIIFLLQFL